MGHLPPSLPKAFALFSVMGGGGGGGRDNSSHISAGRWHAFKCTNFKGCLVFFLLFHGVYCIDFKIIFFLTAKRRGQALYKYLKMEVGVIVRFLC